MTGPVATGESATAATAAENLIKYGTVDRNHPPPPAELVTIPIPVDIHHVIVLLRFARIGRHPPTPTWDHGQQRPHRNNPHHSTRQDPATTTLLISPTRKRDESLRQVVEKVAFLPCCLHLYRDHHLSKVMRLPCLRVCPLGKTFWARPLQQTTTRA